MARHRLSAFRIVTALGVALASGLSSAPSASAATLSADDINQISPDAKQTAGEADPKIIKLGVLLDRAGFSPGVIDGRDGENFQKAQAAFREANGTPDGDLLALLSGRDGDAVMMDYTITPEDTKGPFVKSTPGAFEALAKLPALSYTNVREELAERFHMDEKLLAALNPKANFEQAGTRITVANVAQPQTTDNKSSDKKNADRQSTDKAVKIVVDKTARTLKAMNRDGRVIAYYPASVGSDEKPAPSGAFKVRGVQRNPTYRYNPDFAFKGVKSKTAFTIKPGPNNPVGAVWIDLSAPSYGIHGTPSPEKVGKTESHGCVRLTNWDALKLAGLVGKGTDVVFEN